VVEGAPDQGKSTLAQYICQVHRIRLLERQSDLTKVPAPHQHTPLRIPFKLDLRDLATWLAGTDPFAGVGADSAVPEPRSLESFLARLVRHHSGGMEFDINDLVEVSKLMPLLIVLDGLDEVADIRLRAEVVTTVSRAIPRMRENCDLQLVITSRPAAFANSPGFEPDDFPYLQLGSVRRAQIQEYVKRWMDVRSPSRRERQEIQTIIDERFGEPHLRDLARNPMQLAILLSLIHTEGAALPDKRTTLYDEYARLFFNREADKTPAVRKYLDLLKDIHRYLAWVLHTAAESGRNRAAGRISSQDLREVLEGYLRKEQHKTNIIDEVFGAMLERVVMIVPRI
jgi:predicted NACHT family NTPase